MSEKKLSYEEAVKLTPFDVSNNGKKVADLLESAGKLGRKGQVDRSNEIYDTMKAHKVLTSSIHEVFCKAYDILHKRKQKPVSQFTDTNLFPTIGHALDSMISKNSKNSK